MQTLIGTVFAWTIGLALPLLLRFAVLRKPAPEKAVPSLVVALFFVNLIVFESLGLHAVHGNANTAGLFLIGFVSYRILRVGQPSGAQVTGAQRM